MKSRLILGPARKTGQALPWSVPSEAFFFDAATEFAEAEDCNSNIEVGSEKVFNECVDCARQIAHLREWATSCAACVSYPDWTA